MKIIPATAAVGPNSKAGSQFTGAVFPFQVMAATDGVMINTVNFTPCARTYWHHHENGQILIVLGGQGLIQAEGGPIRIIRAGDMVFAPPGERHWHGGGKDSFMVHTAISLGTTAWAEPVTDEQYDGAVVDE